jgi:tetratricopeptide (TPR) repeat protein
LVLLAVFPYLAALGHPFAYDDYAQVVRNDLVRSLDPGPVLANGSVTHGRVEWYRPLAIYSLALNYAVTGPQPWSYRLVNLALHAANTALVLVIGRVIGTAGGAAAALFAVHAVHSEAVIPAYGRADLLSAFFVLLAWRITLGSRSGAGTAAAAAVLLFAALLSKENAVALLPVVVASDLAVRTCGAPIAVRLRGLVRERWRLYAALAAAVLICGCLRLWAKDTLLGTGGVRYIENPLIQAGPAARAATGLWTMLRYVQLFVVPYPLSVDYSYNQIPVVDRWTDPRLLAVAAATLGGVILFRVRHWSRGAVLALVAFLLFLTPVSNVLVPIGTIMAERLFYLPSVGLCLLAGFGFDAVRARPAGLARRAALVVFASLIAVNSALLVARSRDWASDLRLFSAAVAASPNSAKAHYNHGSALAEAEETRGAEEALRKAVAIAPAYPEAQNLLGTFLLTRGELAEAARAFEVALRSSPDYPPALANLGIVRRRQDRIDEARQLLERAVRLDDSMAVAFVNLGLIAEVEGDVRKAVAHYRRAYALDASLAMVRARAGDLDPDSRK